MKVRSMYTELFELMGMMFLMMLAGWLLQSRGLITEQGRKSLTNIILYAVLPCNIVNAFRMETGEGFWEGMAQTLAAAAVVQILCVALASFLYRRMPKKERQVYQYATVCSNAGFMGNPLAQGVFGDQGLLYASVFLIPLRIVMWTAGVSYFTDSADKSDAVKKVLIHPCMIAVYIGLAIMLFSLPVPGVIERTLAAFSSCCTGMTMLYIGTILAGVDLKSLCSRRQIYFAAVRLILIPCIVYLFCLVLRTEQLVRGVCVLLSAMPAGSTASLLAGKYGADEGTAAKCVVFTTLLSAAAIPVWSMILIH
mgnify:CR=1 FL=1